MPWKPTLVALADVAARVEVNQSEPTLTKTEASSALRPVRVSNNVW